MPWNKVSGEIWNDQVLISVILVQIWGENNLKKSSENVIWKISHNKMYLHIAMKKENDWN